MLLRPLLLSASPFTLLSDNISEHKDREWGGLSFWIGDAGWVKAIVLGLLVNAEGLWPSLASRNS